MANSGESVKPAPGAPGLPGPRPDAPAQPHLAADPDPAAELDFEHLLELEDMSHLSPPSAGEVLTGHVVSVTEKYLIVDVGSKLEGAVPMSQVVTPDNQLLFQPGDAIEVMVDRGEPQLDGFLLLSHERASRLKIWDTLETAYRQNLPVSGRVLGRVKGGLEVDVGTKAFMPSSQLDLRPVHNLDAFLGADIPVKVLKLNRRRGNVVVSRKAAIEEEVTSRKNEVFGHAEEGAEVTGVVKNLTDYGAFVDLGGVDGLLHVSDMSHGRVSHPQEVVHPGETITCKVLRIDRQKERISLGLKQMSPDPWETVEQRYLPGLRVIGRVVTITDYGAFVELEPGVEGLIHISEMTWSRRMKHPSKVVKPGDQVEAVVLDVKSGERRVSLGIKQLEPDPWTTIQDRYSVGSVVEGRIRKLTDFGAFIEVEEGVDGLVHISDFSWTKRLKHPSEMVKKGQMLQAVVLAIDVENRRLSMGVKQLQPDAWETFFRSHFVNDVVRGKVARASSFGVFVEIGPGVEGLCHNSEIPGGGAGAGGRAGGAGDKRRGEESPLPVGAEFEFKIIKMNEAEKKIGLSLREMASVEDVRRIDEYQRRAAAATQGFDDVARGGPEGEDE